jgi:hypothetical protein
VANWPPGDGAAIAAKVVSLIKIPSARKRKNARKGAEACGHFDLEFGCERNPATYQRLCRFCRMKVWREKRAALIKIPSSWFQRPGLVEGRSFPLRCGRFGVSRTVFFVSVFKESGRRPTSLGKGNRHLFFSRSDAG